jgi:hypothetical protein
MKFHPVGAELFHVDGRPDMTKLLVAFGNFANAPKLPNKTLLSCTLAECSDSDHFGKH